MAHIILVLDNQDHRFAGFGQRDHFHFLFLVSGSDPVTVFLLFRQLQDKLVQAVRCLPVEQSATVEFSQRMGQR